MSDWLSGLRAELGDRVLDDAETCDAHRHDAWALAQLHELLSDPAPAPAAVVRARSTEDVSRTLSYCHKAGVTVIPVGGASGVCGGVRAARGAVVLSTRGLEGLIELDDRNLIARFGAGTLGGDAERAVEERGLTIGHWPQSIELSTVGGWVATRAAGQYSTAYGNIEDVVLALEVVLPDGSVLRTRETPRAAAGPDLRQLFLGSEGTLGVVTEVTFSLRPIPEASRGQAFHFADLDDGVDAIRELMRAGWRPPVVRLYDARESARQFSAWCPEARCLLLLLHEGPEAAVAPQLDAVARICAERGAVDTDEAAVHSWLEHRNRVPSFRELNERGLVVDTIEVASTWDRVTPLYEAVTCALLEVPAVILASAHSSHSYRSGTNLYFTFVARPERREQMPAVYLECWHRTMRATLACGAGIAHHHGIGRARRDYLGEELGAAGVSVLRAIKRALDPDGLLNPGVLLPDPEDGA